MFGRGAIRNVSTVNKKNDFGDFPNQDNQSKRNFSDNNFNSEDNTNYFKSNEFNLFSSFKDHDFGGNKSRFPENKSNQRFDNQSSKRDNARNEVNSINNPSSFFSNNNNENNEIPNSEFKIKTFNNQNFRKMPGFDNQSSQRGGTFKFDNARNEVNSPNRPSRPLNSFNNNGTFDLDNRSSHVHNKRSVEEIFEEDVLSSDKYFQIREDDDDITVNNLNARNAIIDKWGEANFHQSLLNNIERAKYTVPRKIQSVVIPLIMDGYDIKGHAETGSGKTAAFLLPIINKIICEKKKGSFRSQRSRPFVLIIEPTRELSIQVYDQARKFCYQTGVTVAQAYGCYRVSDNLKEINNGCDILIGTPGRLNNFFQEKSILCENLKFFILDEADQLLDEKFVKVLRQLQCVQGFPTKENRQNLLFSATFSDSVEFWAEEIVKDNSVMVTNNKFFIPNSKIMQKFEMVMKEEKKKKLLDILENELNEVSKKNSNEKPSLRRTLIFVTTKRDADVIATYLCQANINALTINGDRPQNLREEALAKFRDNIVQVIVATDVCARGIDIKNLDHVINCDLPNDYTTYVHRIGRTGRLNPGFATSFYDPINDQPLAADLIKGIVNAQQEPPQFLIDASLKK